MLVDTSVWVDHFRRTNFALAARLRHGEVRCHPFVIGELACGSLKRRNDVLALLSALPQLPVTDHDHVLLFIESNRLMGTGIGWIDAHLLASARLAGTVLWTLDRRLLAVARVLRIGVEPGGQP